MRTVSILKSALAAAAVALALAGCSMGNDAQQASADRAKASESWKLVLDDPQGTELRIERMDIFLTDDEAYPEIFELRGTGVMLVGQFPADLRVDYGEAFEKMIGKTIPIMPNGGDPREPKSSSVLLQGLSFPVSSGTFTVEKVTGKWSGSEGDKTLHGTVELHIPGADGDRVVTGRFATHAVTWG